MRILFLLLLTACAGKTPPPEIVLPVVVMPDAVPERKPDIRPKPKPPPPVSAAPSPPATAPVPMQNPCANLDTGDLKESIKLKLDCMERNSNALPTLPLHPTINP